MVETWKWKKNHPQKLMMKVHLGDRKITEKVDPMLVLYIYIYIFLSLGWTKMMVPTIGLFSLLVTKKVYIRKKKMHKMWRDFSSIYLSPVTGSTVFNSEEFLKLSSMASEKVETVVAGNYLEMEREEADSKSAKSKLSKFFWHGGSVYDAWFSCSSNQALILILWTNHHI